MFSLVAVGALLLTGCRHDWVEERALEAYAALPKSDKRHVAIGVGDGGWMRGRDAKPEAVVDGTRRRVRVLKPQTVAGLVFVIAGAAWIGGAIAATAAPRTSGPECSGNEGCIAGDVAGISTLFAIGAGDALAGIILLSVGATHAKLPPAARGWRYLR